MNRGRCQCIIKVEHKKRTTEDNFIPPNCYNETFDQLGIQSGSNLVIIEMRGGYHEEPQGEEGEEEQSEMDEEGEEDNED